ncbi:nuclear pore protein 84/107 [Powellomyces hirtus]|nr:nuclear pore protein 84/107 [Powellomyces hirtus]
MRLSGFRESQNVIKGTHGKEYMVGPEYDDFASIALDHTARGADWFAENGLLEKYYAFCKEKADSLQELKVVDPTLFTSTMATELHWWTMEANTWKLIRSLIRLRIQESTVAPMDLGESTDELSDQAIHKGLISSEYREDMTIRQWLEETAPEFQPVETRRGYWPHTVKHINNSRLGLSTPAGDVVTESDPDAPFRQQKNLHADDAEYDANLHRTVYEYIRRGRIGDAMDLYEACDQPWRAASLRGGMLSNDPDVDDPSQKVGNQNRDLWKAVCHQIASNDRIDPFERAIYAISIGDTQNAAPVCKLWEDQVWMHYCALIELQIDQNLRSVPLSVEADDEIEVDFQTTALEPTAIFERLEKSDSPYLKHAAHESFHVAQKSIILNDIGAFLSKVRTQLQGKDGADSSRTHYNPHFLRFVTHFILILKELPIEIPSDDANFILEEYVKLLTESRKNTIIAFYASHLPSRVQLERYAIFLERVLEDPDMNQYVRLAKRYGLNYAAIAKRTIQLIFHGPGGILQTSIDDIDVRDLLIAQVNEGPTPAEDHQIQSLGLLMLEENLWSDALWFANLLLRRFLVFGRVNSALAVRQFLQAQFGDQKYLDKMVSPQWIHSALAEDPANRATDPEMGEALTEHLQINAFLDAMKLQSEWLGIWYRRPNSNTGNLDGSTSLEYREWVHWLTVVSKTAAEAFEALLDGNWMMHLVLQGDPADGEDQVAAEVELLREIYVPQMVIFLHQIYRETKDLIPGNREKAIALADRVQHEDYLHDNLEKSDKLDAFLEIVRQSALSLTA